MNPALVELPSLAGGAGELMDIELHDNAALPHLDALATWTTSDPSPLMILNRCPALMSVAELAGPLASAGPPGPTVLLTDLPALASLAGIENLTVANHLVLSGLGSVSERAPLAQLTAVTDGVILDGMPAVQDLSGLAALVSSDRLEVGTCLGTGIDGGLASLTTVTGLLVVHDDGMVSLGGAPALNNVGDARFWDDPGLSGMAISAWVAAVEPVQVCIDPGEQSTCAA